MKLIGLNVGGTFTNTVAFSEEGLQIAKVPSYRGDLTKILDESLEKLDVELDKDTSMVVSFPLAMHTVLERSGVKAGLITTEGFSDSLEIQEGRKPYVLNGQQDRIVPLIRRRHTKGVSERIDPDGKVLVPLDMQQLSKAVQELVDSGVKYIAICFLYSFCNDEHEIMARDFIKKKFPEVGVCISSEVAPIMGEFRRMSTTAINAYVSSKVNASVQEIDDFLKRKGLPSNPLFLQSSGGVITSDAVKEGAVQLMSSCPAGGVMGAVNFFGKDYKDIITVDMGGTTTDVCLIKDGKPPLILESKVDDYLLQIPVIDIPTISIGGGSIARNDDFGALMVGPEGTGSEPGPACFGKGGNEATVTDALVVMGMYHDKFSGSGVSLDASRAKKVVAKIAQERNVSEEKLVEEIYRLYTSKVAHTLGTIMRKAGFDARDFTLVAFGGSGPAHCAYIAQELGVKRMVIPAHAGSFSGIGLLTIDFVHELGRSYFTILENADGQKIENIFIDLEKKAVALLRKEGVEDKDISITRMADLRYINQVTELGVVLPRDKILTDKSILSSAFHQMHDDIYGFSYPEDPTEMTILRVQAVGKIPTINPQKIDKGNGDLKVAIKNEREVLFPFRGKVNAKVIDRNLLRGGDKISGPAIIEEDTSTTVLPPEMEAEVDDYGNIVISI